MRREESLEGTIVPHGFEVDASFSQDFRVLYSPGVGFSQMRDCAGRVSRYRLHPCPEEIPVEVREGRSVLVARHAVQYSPCPMHIPPADGDDCSGPEGVSTAIRQHPLRIQIPDGLMSFFGSIGVPGASAVQDHPVPNAVR